MAPPPVIRLHPDDSVAIARATLLPGTAVADAVVAAERIPAGHKVAVRSIAVGEPVRRYGQIIGFASRAIAPGQHVHVQNCTMGDFAKDYAYGLDARPTDHANTPRTFDGIRRPDGRVATRNYIGILTSVNCSAHVAGLIADVFRRNPFTGDDPLAEFPLEKSLGAMAKAGSTNLVDVVGYAEPVTAKGFVFMDTPGYDPVSATGQVAGGANLVCFTTGRGSVFGCKPAPSIKLATNTPMYLRMADDMDVNCGTILDGGENVQQCGQRIFDLMLRVAGGERTKSEQFDFGAAEFAPWVLGATM